jgi:hypothetical protein
VPCTKTSAVTPDEAWAAILAGRTVRVVVGPDPEDPTCLHYLDRCWEDYHKPLIYTEAIGGWSEGVKEAICDPGSNFYVEFVSDPVAVSLTVSDEVPPQRESERPVTWRAVP